MEQQWTQQAQQEWANSEQGIATMEAGFFEYFEKFTPEWLRAVNVYIEDWFFVFAMGLLGLELIRLLIKKQFSWNTLGDIFANFVTLAAHMTIIAVGAGFFLAVYYSVFWYATPMPLPINGWTIAGAIMLADLAYYWEHRIAHRVGVFWATHTVHHSSPHFNISVAYRHGPLDTIVGLPFHLMIVFAGFEPILVLFAAAMVQLFQTALHTEAVGMFPRFIEAIFNTPSHHRVHHGSNRQYIDKNYAGILIIWDKMFGTFAEEQEKVKYGVAPAINSVNPLKVYFHGFTRLASKVIKTPGFGNKLAVFIKPPGWSPKKPDAAAELQKQDAG